MGEWKCVIFVVSCHSLHSIITSSTAMANDTRSTRPSPTVCWQWPVLRRMHQWRGPAGHCSWCASPSTRPASSTSYSRPMTVDEVYTPVRDVCQMKSKWLTVKRSNTISRQWVKMAIFIHSFIHSLNNAVERKKCINVYSRAGQQGKGTDSCPEITEPHNNYTTNRN